MSDVLDAEMLELSVLIVLELSASVLDTVVVRVPLVELVLSLRDVVSTKGTEVWVSVVLGDSNVVKIKVSEITSVVLEVSGFEDSLDEVVMVAIVVVEIPELLISCKDVAEVADCVDEDV